MVDQIEDLPHPPGPEVETAPRPVVILQYRRGLGSRLTTPILLVITALAVLSHRVKIDDWRGLFGSFPEPEAIADRPAALRSSVPLASPPPTLRTAWASSSTDPPVTAPRPLAILPTPSRAAHPTIAIPHLGDETADAWREIRRVSEMAKAEARDMEDLKARAFAQSQRFAAAHRIEAALVNAQATKVSRQDFLQSLRLALAQPDGRGAQFVEDLCRKHGVSLAADRPVPGTLSDPELTRTEVWYRVENLRARGITEVAILDELVRLESRKRAARSGPKSREEVVVRAARQLLAVQSTRSLIDTE